VSKTEGRITSADANYQALAWQVKQRIEAATESGRKLKIIDAVRIEMDASAKLSAEGIRAALNLVDARIDTHYTEARKWLRRWGKVPPPTR
jgi:hypothetical protein